MWAWVSSALLLTILCTLPLRAHEVQPAVSDLTITGNTLTWEIMATLEPLIAGANLEGLENTNDSDRAAEIDGLRALNPPRCARPSPTSGRRCRAT